MAKREPVTADYDALFREANPDTEYEIKKRLGQVDGQEEVPVNVEEMLRALDSLDIGGEKEKERIRGQMGYGDGTESKELQKAKYGDIPDQLFEIPEGKYEPLERGEPWDPQVEGEEPIGGFGPDGDVDNFPEPKFDDMDDDKSTEDLNAMLGIKKKSPSIAATKITASKSAAPSPSKDSKKEPPKMASVSKEKVEVSGDRNLPEGAVKKAGSEFLGAAKNQEAKPSAPANKPKEKVILSADTLKPQSTQHEPEEDIPWSWKHSGPKESYLKSVDGPQFEKGIEEEELPWMIGGGLSGLVKKAGKAGLAKLGSKLLGSAEKPALESSLKGLLGSGEGSLTRSEALTKAMPKSGAGEPLAKLEGLTKTGSRGGRIGALEREIPKLEAGKAAPKMLEAGTPTPKSSLGDDVSGVRALWDKIRSQGPNAQGEGTFMFPKASGRTVINPKGEVGRRMDLISRDAESVPDSFASRGIKGSKTTTTPGNRAGSMRVGFSAPSIVDPDAAPGLWSTQNMTRSDIGRITQELNKAVKSGGLTIKKYSDLLRRLGRTESEIQAEVMRAGLKK